MSSPSKQKVLDRIYNDLDFELLLRTGAFKVQTAAKGQFGMVPMTMDNWPIQQALFREALRQYRETGRVRIIICKSRKRGCSTWIQAFSKFIELVIKGTMSLTVAHERPATENIFRIGKTIAENVPEWLGAELKSKPQSGRVEWKSGSYSICMTQGGSVDSFRSFTPTFLHISELPSWESNRKDTSASDVAQALLNSVPDGPNTFVFIESTAKGVGNLFHEMWQNAERGVRGNEFVPMFFPWSIDSDCRIPAPTTAQRADEKATSKLMKKAHAENDLHAFHGYANQLGYSQLQRDRAIEFDLDPEQVRFWQSTLINKCGNDQDKFDEEWPLSAELAFVSSGRNVFSASKLKERRDLLQKRPQPMKGKFNDDLDFVVGSGGWEIYEKPEKGEQYIISADVAGGGRGKDDDYSAIQVLKRRGRVQVAEFYGKVYPEDVAHQVAGAFRFYKAYMAAPENNGPGLLTVHFLMRKYPEVVLYREFMRAGKVKGSPSTSVGYPTNSGTRPYMMGLLESGVRNGTFEINSTRLIDELMGIVRTKTGRIEAQTGGNDDATVAAGIALDLDQILSEQGISAYEPTGPGTYGYGDGPMEGVHPIFDGVDRIDLEDTYEIEWDWN